MSIRNLNHILLIAVIAIAAFSCKKKDDDIEAVYVDGTLTFELPEFIQPNQVIKMTPKGLTHPDGGVIGYYWKVNPTMAKFDTTRFLNGLDAEGKPSDGTFNFAFPDTLQTYTVYCNAFSEGYSTSSKNLSTTVVKPGPEQSITNTGIDVTKDPYYKFFGNEYYYVTIGELDWLRQDLAYTQTGIPFRNGSAMDGVFGKYFTHEEALSACPEEWRLPTDAEWASLAKEIKGDKETDYTHKTVPGIAGKLMTDAYFNEVKMWEYWPSVGKLTNESGMGMIPTGYVNFGPKDSNGNYPSAKFIGVYEYAVYWTADKAEDGMAYYRYIYCEEPDFVIGKGDPETFGASVRCVRDKKI